MRALIVGTGYLGRTLKVRLEHAGTPVAHTFHRQRMFADSVKFDMFSHYLGDIVDMGCVDTVIVTSKVEHQSDAGSAIRAMARLFDACMGKRVLYLSSDAVFDGRRGQYLESDAPSPRTSYGKCKVQCEVLLREKVADHCIFRTSYIYGSSTGYLDARLHEAIDAMAFQKPYARYVDMFKTPVEVNQLAAMVDAVAASDYRGVLHACGVRMSVYDFVKEALEALGVSTDHLEQASMGRDTHEDGLVDTSLDANIITTRFGFKPLRPADALRAESRS